MNTDISAALNDWQFIRSNTIEYIKGLGDDGLKQPLPRPGLNTFCKHFQEMLSVQTSYIEAIGTGEMSFDNVPENDAFDGQESVQELLARIEKSDAELADAVAEADPNLEINWPEEDVKTLTSHLSNLSIHEMFHIGQLVAFCYAQNVPIPEYLVEIWALSPQEL